MLRRAGEDDYDVFGKIFYVWNMHETLRSCVSAFATHNSFTHVYISLIIKYNVAVFIEASRRFCRKTSIKFKILSVLVSFFISVKAVGILCNAKAVSSGGVGKIFSFCKIPAPLQKGAVVSIRRIRWIFQFSAFSPLHGRLLLHGDRLAEERDGVVIRLVLPYVRLLAEERRLYGRRRLLRRRRIGRDGVVLHGEGRAAEELEEKQAKNGAFCGTSMHRGDLLPAKKIERTSSLPDDRRTARSPRRNGCGRSSPSCRMRSWLPPALKHTPVAGGTLELLEGSVFLVWRRIHLVLTFVQIQTQ